MNLNPGYKTTEFWISILSPMFAVLLNQLLGWNIAPEFLAGLFGVNATGYSISRGLAKGTVIKNEGSGK